MNGRGKGEGSRERSEERERARARERSRMLSTPARGFADLPDPLLLRGIGVANGKMSGKGKGETARELANYVKPQTPSIDCHPPIKKGMVRPLHHPEIKFFASFSKERSPCGVTPHDPSPDPLLLTFFS